LFSKTVPFFIENGVILKDIAPATDNYSENRTNSLRLLDKKNKISQDFECKDMCLANNNCVKYVFDRNTQNCELYRKEPYKHINDLSLDDCKMTCFKDNTCDYLSHGINNTCELYTRENYIGKSKIGNAIFDFPIYGYNSDNGIITNTFEECKNKYNDFVYNNNKKCIPKIFGIPKLNNTTIYFDRFPVDTYGSLQVLNIDRHYIDKYKDIIFTIFFILIIVIVIIVTKYFIN